MRKIFLLLLASTATPAFANTSPDIAPAPAWVKRVPLTIPADRSALPVRILLLDQQGELTRGSIAAYSEVAGLIQTAAGLGAGNISLTWRPDVDTVAVNTLTITRAGKTIDVLAKQKFTVIRRETNLDQATLDGRLTASVIIDGVEVGDVVTLATTVISRDPTLAGHVEAEVGQWNGAIDHAHARLHWAKGVPLRLRSSPGLPAYTTTSNSTGTTIELSGDRLQPIVPPKGAPQRYSLGRFVEATDYASWADISRLMAPLYAKASAIAPASPLTAEIARIRAAAPTPAARASAALDLVESKIRYVALQMGVGGYVPATADATWTSRFGDCKAKTALLLALLHGLDITAVPILVSSSGGDGLDQRLPSVGRFDHVLVRATISGRDYYLDATRTGDKDIARLDVPGFHWGLPLAGAAPQLARLTPRPRPAPDSDYALSIDARDGIFAPAKAHSQVTYTGDSALVVKAAFEALPDASRDSALRDFFRGTYDFIEPSKLAASFDPATGVETLSMDGIAKLKWSDNWSRIPGSSLAWEADFARPDGPDKDAPFAVDFPAFNRASTTIQLPPNVKLWPGKLGHDVDQTLAGVHYHREASLTAGTLRLLKSQVALAPEVDAATARAAQARLRTLNDEDVHLDNDQYVATDADLVALKATTPDSAAAWFKRGLLFNDRSLYAEAAADFTEANRLAGKDAWILANRGIAYFWLGKMDEALADAAAATALEPTNPVAARVRGLVAADKSDHRAAVTAYTASLASMPNNAFTLRRRALEQMALGETGPALADVDALMRVPGEEIEAHSLRAALLKQQGKPDAAALEANALLAMTPATPAAIYAAVNILVSLNQRDRAIAALTAANARAPNPDLLLRRSEVRDPADVAARRADIDAALKLRPDMPDAIANRADLAFEQHDDRAAIADYTTLLGIGATRPQDVSLMKLHLYRGLALAHSGDKVAAQREFAAATAASVTPGSDNQLCWIRITKGGDPTAALADCNRALKAAPTAAGALDSRGLVYLRLDRLDEALADLNAALKVAPRQAASLYARSIVWARKGDATKAAADRTAAIALSPDIAAEYARYGIKPPS